MDKLEMYQHMYAMLCAAASEAIEHMDAQNYGLAREALRSALERAEECYIDADKK